MTKYRVFAVIGRHGPTDTHRKLAARKRVELNYIADLDPHDGDTIDQVCGYDGVIVVHPYLAARAARAGLAVGVFNSATRELEIVEANDD